MRSEPPDTLPENSIPAPYDGEGAVPDGAPLWFRDALAELRAERVEMVSMLGETLARVEARDERMMSMLESTLNQALSNETRLNRLEDQLGEQGLAIKQLQLELRQLKGAA